MPYRDSPDALNARIARLEEDLQETKDDLARTRERYTRAMAALRIIAHSKKLTEALQGSKLSPEELARLTHTSPSELPPAPVEPREARTKPDTKMAAKKKRARKSSKKKPASPRKRPTKRSNPKGEGVYVMFDRKDGVER